MRGIPAIPPILAIAIVVLTTVGTLIGIYITWWLVVSRLAFVQRLRRLLAAPAADARAEYDDAFALAGIEGSARSLVRLVCSESDCRFALLFLPHQGDDRLSVASAEGDSSSFEAIELSRFDRLLRRLEASGQPIEIDESMDEAPLPPRTLIVPILSRGRLLGVLAVGPRLTGRSINERSRSAIALAASQAAAPLENAQLYASLRRAFSDLEDAQRELLALQRVSIAAQSTLQVDEVLAQIAQGVEDGLSFDHATVYLVDTETRTLSMPVSHSDSGGARPRLEPVPFDESNPSMRALLGAEVFITHDIRESILPRLIEAGALSSRDIPADLTVANLPLASRGRVIGGMALTSRRPAVSERQVESLRTFAAQAAAAIENARLYGQLERAYSDLRTAQEQLIRAERLRTLGQVAGGVAHDFNNILAAILTRAQLAQQQTRSPILRESLQVIEQAALDGASIARRIQSLSRPPAGREPEVVDLNLIVQQALEFTQPMWLNAAQARGVSIVTETSYEQIPPVEGQASELREVITNLVLNAAAAMPEGGTLGLKTSKREGYVWCAVEDSGTGMTEEVKRQMFDPFFTTKDAGGSGLGMSIVAAIVERHQGRIEVESEPGQGTTVRIGFPITSTRFATQKRHRRRGQVSLRLLIVEEDERTSEALSLILSRHGHRVSTAGTSEIAIRLLVQQEFDVVITDLGLGRHSGWEVAEAAKAIRPNAAVILVSAWGSQWEPEEARSRGVDAVLSKPFTVDEVFSSLEKALVGAR